MNAERLEALLAVLLLIAGLLSLISRFVVSIAIGPMSATVSDRLNVPEELYLGLMNVMGALSSVLGARVSLTGVWVVVIEVVAFLLAGVVALVLFVPSAREERQALIKSLGGLLLLVGAALALVMGFKSVGRQSVVGYFETLLLAFAIIGLGLILCPLADLLNEERRKGLALVAALLILLSGIFYLVSRLVAIARLGGVAGYAGAEVGLYYLPFLAALLLLLGATLRLLEILSQ